MQENIQKTKLSRMTRQRSVILSELRKVTSHPTAEQLYSIVKECLPRISLGTVYRNLEFLVESGDVRKIDSAGNIRRFDGDMSPHSHARCEICGEITDIFDNPIKNVDLNKVEINNFTITSACVDYTGICHTCASKEPMYRQ